MKGDIIQFEWMQNPDPNGSLYDHTGIVVDIVGGEPYIAAHTVDHDSEPLSNFMPWEKIRFIHIERSNGYPPVKAKITQGSDDAGINPTGCAFSATNNEVYLGSCFSGGNIISGFRFNNIQIPQGAQIKYAYLTYTVDGTYTVPIDVQIYGEDAEDSATFSAGSPPSSRSTPYSPVLWNITDTWSLGLRRTTPQLSSVVQNIVNRSDWLPGYSLSIIVKNAGANVRRVIAIERSGFAPNFSPAKLIAAYEYSGPPISSLPFNSVGSQDGWVLESTENSGVGGSLDSNATSFRLGDDSSNRQYRGILHFDTANLPDTAVITSVILKIKQQGSIAGTNPFTTHGSLMVDIRQPSFDSAALQVGDFQAVAGQSGIATFDPAPVSSWYKAVLNNAAFPHINLTGTTQFRLYFTLDDNNDLGADYMAFSSGNNATAANRPQLLVVYYIP